MPDRRRRGRDTEHLVADYLRRNGFPHAEPAAASTRGSDVLGIPDLDVEVAARRGLPLAEKLKQQDKRLAAGQLGVIVVRLDGAGPTTVGTWPCVVRLDDLTRLLTAAGYTGTP